MKIDTREVERELAKRLQGFGRAGTSVITKTGSVGNWCPCRLHAGRPRRGHSSRHATSGAANTRRVI
jgi:hypothetical protein